MAKLRYPEIGRVKFANHNAVPQASRWVAISIDEPTEVIQILGRNQSRYVLEKNDLRPEIGYDLRQITQKIPIIQRATPQPRPRPRLARRPAREDANLITIVLERERLHVRSVDCISGPRTAVPKHAAADVRQFDKRNVLEPSRHCARRQPSDTRADF